MDIVINYDSQLDRFKIYEVSTDTVLISTSLTEGLINLSQFLRSKGLIGIDKDLFDCGIVYHLDTQTMIQMVKSNVDLLKRLKTGISEFKNSSNKFGGSSGNSKVGQFGKGSKNFSNSEFSKQKSSFGKSASKFGNIIKKNKFNR